MKEQDMRASWTGKICFDELTVAIKLYPATRPGALSFISIDALPASTPAPQPLREGPTAAQQGQVLAFELDDGEYIYLNEEDFKLLAPDSPQKLKIEHFVPRERIDPLAFARSYFAIPRPSDAAHYAIFCKSLQKSGTYAIGTLFIQQKNAPAALWVRDEAIVVSTLRPSSEIARTRADLSKFDIRARKTDIDRTLERIRTRTTSQDIRELADRCEDELVALLSQKIIQYSSGNELGFSELPSAARADSAAAPEQPPRRGMEKSHPPGRDSQKKAS